MRKNPRRKQSPRTLSRLRRRIDRIDLELGRLLNRRAARVLQVGEVKKKRGLPVFDGKRESAVLNRLMRSNVGPLSKKSIREIFSEILRHNRKLQGS